MHSREIRRKFSEFFEENGHLLMSSSSLVPPANDKTVLLTTAGMQQMKPFFLGLEKPPRTRLTTVQKCFRTVDIDEVGDSSHLTFFEMLGNFSVGDYFKDGAIQYAWNLMTKGYGLPPEKLFITAHISDDEAADIWINKIGLEPSRVTRRDEDNWWIAGETGPCGPCSEIYYDLGPEVDPDPNAVVGDSPRFLEVWNLVFMQFNKDEKGQLTPLPFRNIDTGMGLERLSMILQGKSTLHETDSFMPIIERAAQISGKTYGQNEKSDYSLRVIADHSRASAFLIADGVLPGTTEREYVLRRVMRRAIRHGRLLGIEKPFLKDTVQVVIDNFGEFYPELVSRQKHIFSVIEREEESFGRTLQAGLNRFEVLIETNPLAGEESKTISGKDVFDLSATHGFPPDLTRELAEERGYTIDWEGYQKAEAEHRTVSSDPNRFRAKQQNLEPYKAIAAQIGRVPFRGYETTTVETEIVAVFVNGESVQSAEAGQDAEVVVKETPFYVESGGQVSDTGYISTAGGRITVENTYRPVADLVVHQGKVSEGHIVVGDTATAVVEEDRRLDTARNHTGTHILHQALKDVLGDGVGQAGSLVAPDRLRFDFTYPNAVTPDELLQIEQIVNAKVRADLDVTIELMPIEEAKKSGAVMMFGEKYGDTVRVLSIGDYSRELCGGTHLHHSGQIGMMLIVNESSIGSGLRRVEAVTGRMAEKYVQERLRLINNTATALQTRPEQLADEAAELKRKLRETERELATLRQKQAQSQAGDLVAQAVEVEGVKVLSTQVSATTNDILQSVGDKLRDSLGSGVVSLGAVINEKPSLLIMVSKDLVDKGLKAGTLIVPVASAIGGRAGGRPERAQGGGTDASKLGEALALVPDLVRKELAGK